VTAQARNIVRFVFPGLPAESALGFGARHGVQAEKGLTRARIEPYGRSTRHRVELPEKLAKSRLELVEAARTQLQEHINALRPHITHDPRGAKAEDSSWFELSHLDVDQARDVINE
jgi:hypothetical protein